MSTQQLRVRAKFLRNESRKMLDEALLLEAEANPREEVPDTRCCDGKLRTMGGNMKRDFLFVLTVAITVSVIVVILIGHLAR